MLTNNKYKEKYREYKNKYKKLKNINNSASLLGNSNFIKKTNEIIRFLTKSTKEKIKKDLYNLLYYDAHCPIIFGEGHFGRVYAPRINNTMFVKHGNITLELPIIIKELKNNQNPHLSNEINIIDNVLYISGFDNMTTPPH